MDTFTTASRRTATRTLSLIMGSAAIAWVLFVIARYVTLVSSAGSMEEYGQPEQIRVADYVTFAAIAILGLGALFAKRSLARLRASIEPCSALVKPVSLLASLMLIITSALAAWTVVFTFMSGFNASPDQTIPLARMMNLYLPIVLYTALVVILILAGFVFLPSALQQQIYASNTSQAPISAAQQEPGDTRQEPELAPRSGRRTAGLAYAIPIIDIAFALILGLIVYDLTRTALQVWIWVAIFAIVGAGILTGTLFATRSRGSSDISAPVVTGAKNLNFVLAVIFAVVVTSMSLGYSSLAFSKLNISPSLSLSVYTNSEKFEESQGETITVDNPQFSLWGSDLKEGTEVVVTVEPSGEEFIRARVGHNRWVNSEEAWDKNLAPGEYKFIARAEAADGVPLDVSLTATVRENGDVDFPADGTAYSGTEKNRLLAISAGWLFGDLLPAGVLLALGIALVSSTITVRNPDRPVTQ